MSPSRRGKENGSKYFTEKDFFICFSCLSWPGKNGYLKSLGGLKRAKDKNWLKKQRKGSLENRLLRLYLRIIAWIVRTFFINYIKALLKITCPQLLCFALFYKWYKSDWNLSGLKCLCMLAIHGQSCLIISSTWIWRTTAWRDAEWEDAVLGPRPVRSRTGPWTRWANDVSNFCRQEGLGEWKRAA